MNWKKIGNFVFNNYGRLIAFGFYILGMCYIVGQYGETQIVEKYVIGISDIYQFGILFGFMIYGTYSGIKDLYQSIINL